MGTGFAEVRGVLDVLRQSDSHTSQTIADHSTQIADHDRRIAQGERERAAAEEVRQSDRRRLQQIIGLVGLAGTALTIAATLISLSAR
ncbi:hypothetical protein [Kitasatospora sp. NPDC056184]|uniref:hypothetical protein n=1 Tax=Kitasatospora sp. NPDC056184 TaxID=3345738 RepID=UPI0035E3432E